MKSPYYINQEGNPAVLSTKKAIEHALHEEGVSLTIPEEHTGITGFYEDNLKVNKIAFAVIDQYDMPAVRTWYKYGQYEPYDELTPEALDIGFVNELDEYVYTNWKKDITVGDLVDSLKEFDLSEIFEMELFEFLKKNYTGWAPDPFEPIYLASTEIIQVLEEIRRAPLDAFETKVPEWRAKIKEKSIDIRYWIKNLEYFPEAVFTRIESFLSLLEDALIAVETSDNLFTKEDHRVLSGARETYHEYVWPFAAMSISLKEIEGPDDEVEEYDRRGEDIHDELESQSKTYLKGWKQELYEQGLNPSLNQRQSIVQAGREVGNLVDSGIGKPE